jgi:hypothetical protein
MFPYIKDAFLQLSSEVPMYSTEKNRHVKHNEPLKSMQKIFPLE